MKKSLQINSRLTTEQRATFDEIEMATGLKDQAILKTLVHAVCEHYKKHRTITLPIELVERSEERPTQRKARAS